MIAKRLSYAAASLAARSRRHPFWDCPVLIKQSYLWVEAEGTQPPRAQVETPERTHDLYWGAQQEGEWSWAEMDTGKILSGILKGKNQSMDY